MFYSQVLIIDSRSFTDYNACHIQSAVNISYSKVVKRRLQQDKVNIFRMQFYIYHFFFNILQMNFISNNIFQKLFKNWQASFCYSGFLFSRVKLSFWCEGPQENYK